MRVVLRSHRAGTATFPTNPSSISAGHSHTVGAISRRSNVSDEVDSSAVEDLVWVRGLKPPASASQTLRATNCATPRYSRAPQLAGPACGDLDTSRSEPMASTIRSLGTLSYPLRLLLRTLHDGHTFHERTQDPVYPQVSDLSMARACGEEGCRESRAPAIQERSRGLVSRDQRPGVYLRRAIRSSQYLCRSVPAYAQLFAVFEDTLISPY